MSERQRRTPAGPIDPPDFDRAHTEWRAKFDAQHEPGRPARNRSGIAIKPLYSPQDWDSRRYMDELGFPGQDGMTRGIYPTMHRGRPWTQRQLVGLGTPQDTNRRQRMLLAQGATAVSIGPCNVQFRGYDYDEVNPELIGICGAALSSLEDLDEYLAGIPIAEVSIGNNDCVPFTIAAQLLVLANQRGVPWSRIRGTSNQSDYISHFIANHMFFRLSLAGSRRVLTDHIEFMNEHVPGWNPVSVVGQHMQQAGATPAQAMAFTLSTAIQYANDCIARGMEPDEFLPRFSFFFDISISFFEEVAKFRAGRRLWARITRDRLGAKDPRSMRFKFHGQTSGADLTYQQPLNNIARVAVQAMAGIFGGLQSLHTDSYDEALSTPTEGAARIAVNTQNILREEACLDKVIDPLGGSFYVENLTNEMEEEISNIISIIDDAGGMYAAAEQGIVQRMIGEAALDFHKRIESGEQVVVGVNAYRDEEGESRQEPLERPDAELIQQQIARLRAFKAGRDQGALRKAMSGLTASATDAKRNVFAEILHATQAGATHGEIVACLRNEMGFGTPLVQI
jgi:methylmalonyl-CoA mutase N-terminal domain/subunit